MAFHLLYRLFLHLIHVIVTTSSLLQITLRWNLGQWSFVSQLKFSYCKTTPCFYHTVVAISVCVYVDVMDQSLLPSGIQHNYRPEEPFWYGSNLHIPDYMNIFLFWYAVGYLELIPSWLGLPYTSQKEISWKLSYSISITMK